MRYDAKDWDATVEALRAARTVVIACHVNPDGDALGSLLAASIGLRRLGKTTHPTWDGTEALLPLAYRFLPGADTLVPAAEAAKVDADTFLALDCGASDRLGILEPASRRTSCLINVDHHPGNEDFGDLNIVIIEASSTAELVTYLLKDLGVALDRELATCLYTGLVTDTGRFQYSNAKPETLRLAADLLSFEVSAPEIATEVFESAPFGYLKLLGRVLERATLLEEERLVYSWITLADLGETGVSIDETEKLIDLLRATRDADVAVMFKEQPDGQYRVSLRSRGPVSVGAIARERGGGGHELAAGFTTDSVESGVSAIRAALPE